MSKGEEWGEGAGHVRAGSPRRAFKLIQTVWGSSWRRGGTERSRQEAGEKLGSNRWVKNIFVSDSFCVQVLSVDRSALRPVHAGPVACLWGYVMDPVALGSKLKVRWLGLIKRGQGEAVGPGLRP